MYDAKEVAIFHNICSPYRDRSHFDGQNVLETGGTGPHVLQDGWLNRALAPMGLGDGEHALAVAQTPPLMLSGPARATSWMPATLPAPDEAFLARVRALYANDAVLSASLASALELQTQAHAAMDDPSAKKPGSGWRLWRSDAAFQRRGQAARRRRRSARRRARCRRLGHAFQSGRRTTASWRGGCRRSTRVSMR